MAEGEAIVSIRERLLKERHVLLDLSTRNRLLNTPLRTRNNRAIEIVDEKAGEVFRLLIAGRTMTFLPGAQLSEEEKAKLDPEDDVTGAILQPGDDQPDEMGVSSRHLDTRIQTRLTSEGLQKRLFDIWYDAQMLEQEQGVNILFLAIGLLRWFDSEKSDIAKHAPLVLLPVRLERTSAADKFKLKWRDEPPSPNLTLQAKMEGEFALSIEDFKDEDEVDPGAYCAKIAETVRNQKRWEVLPNAMVLGFFSFSKFLMYRDLDPENWPLEGGIEGHPLVTALLRDGFPESQPLVSDTGSIDEAIPPIELHHVVDADSSQTVAIAEASAGRTLVVKGPPGTGKSQTITNIIAAAVARGRKVLFVSEKMAALDVVHRRLRQVGLGPMALELHSNKISKRAVLEELRRTRDEHFRVPRGDLTIIQKLGESGSALNAFASQLHTPLLPSGLSPYQILGFLTKAQQLDAPSGIVLEGAASWTESQVGERRHIVEELAERLTSLGPVPHHTWRGIRCDAMDPVEREQIGLRIQSLRCSLEAAVAHAIVAEQILGAPCAATFGDLTRSAAFLAISKTPANLDRSSLAHSSWSTAVDDLKRVVEVGVTHSERALIVADVFNEAGHAAIFDKIRMAVVTKGGSLFRLLSGEYRAQIALLRSYLKRALPKPQSARIELIDSMIAAQSARRAFAAAAPIGEAFGVAWRAENSDWDELRALVLWRQNHAELPTEVWARLATAPDPVLLIDACEGLRTAFEKAVINLEALTADLNLDLRRSFGVNDLHDIHLDELLKRLSAWHDNLESITRFIAFASRGRTLAALGVGSLVEAIHDGILPNQTLVPAFDRAYAEILRVVLFSAWPDLKGFDGESQNHLVNQFRHLDRARISLAKEQIGAMHAEGRPRGAAGIGPLGVLNAEMAKKRSHLPIRQLLEKAGAPIQQLKPVFMMSPLSVAQFLKPGGLSFDLLVMDEASQIEPVDALGAVARVQQMVVVGDERQLPPTAFFKKLTGEEDVDEVDDGVAIQAKDAESILELCLAKGVPFRMLSWHYRSKHQSLIAVSNREFYENKLFIVPSPYDAIAGMGLKFNLLNNAPYDRGGTRTNPIEAKFIAQAVVRHARINPSQSLGVATFSVAQRQAILKELELLRRANPDIEDFFGVGSAEQFFVKNLENIQGDERDVIFISVGYGKTAEGYLAHGFGPLSGEGGERRLNVLISRAKLRCEVFSNFTGADIDLERTRARGVAALKLFLTFAETGNFGLGEATGADHDSEFEIQVFERLRSRGYDVKSQIGASGFRVDLAVADPEKPGRFVLGIECDGAQYHSSRSARDRDRLRQQVLEAHGWIIHRIWSADWYLRPQEELNKVEAAIATARSEWRQRDEAGYQLVRAVPLSFETECGDDLDNIVPVVVETSSAAVQVECVSYVEAKFTVNRSVEPHEAPLVEMAAYVVRIVEAEGPIHLDEITARIRTLWGLGRAGSRIRAAVDRAASIAVKRDLILGGPFYTIPGQQIVVRDRSRVLSPSLRKPDMLPPSEVELALLKLVDSNFGASRNELVQAVSRSFGFAATSIQLRNVLEEGIDRLLASGQLILKDHLLVRGKSVM